ncbi:MAG: arginase [Bacteroidetes bacterium GWE2_29_8]|nr:MAG: arginase [Bacteroidetes bacterium GWE2_29_8]OFY20109.1 MAG: arginase [Bacteroidetes bacterium GWF2_29_10]
MSEIDISLYFEPVQDDCNNLLNSEKKLIGNSIYIFKEHFPNYIKADIAIIGVREDRNSVDNKGCDLTPDLFRTFFYKLTQCRAEQKIVDLGNIKSGNEINDTYFALKQVIEELIKHNVIPIIIGGSQDLTYACYQAYESLEQVINIVSIDSIFDLGKYEEELNSENYLSKIILKQPNYLFNYTNIGYQSYFVDQDTISLMRKLFFDVYRLGEIQSNIEEVEPLVRNSDFLTFDFRSIRYSDSPCNPNASPNGFYGEDACQIARYAGMSDKLSLIGFFELNARNEKSGQSLFLLAQMIWYFIEGFYSRKDDIPIANSNDFIKYYVSIHDSKYEIPFYKSKKTNRWWMEVTCPVEKSQYERHHLIPCSYKDYQTASNDELPDRWWQAFQKLI